MTLEAEQHEDNVGSKDNERIPDDHFLQNITKPMQKSWALVRFVETLTFSASALSHQDNHQVACN